MINTDKRNNSKLNVCARDVGIALGMVTLAGGAVGSFSYFGVVKPREDDLNTLTHVVRSARPVGDDAYLLSVEADNLRTWQRTKKGDHPDPHFPDTLKVLFEREHPSLEVIAILDPQSTLSSSPRFQDLNESVKQLKDEQLIFVVSKR